MPYLGLPHPKLLVAPTEIHIRHYAFSKTIHFSSSSSFAVTGSLFILSLLPSWQCPHALVHSSPCFLQVHLRVLHPSKQLQWIIWISASGAGLVCHHWNKFVPFYLPSPLRWRHFITTSHPLHNLVVSPQRMKFTGRGSWWESFWRDEHRSSRNFLAEHIVPNRCQWVLLICIEQCNHCLTTIGCKATDFALVGRMLLNSLSLTFLCWWFVGTPASFQSQIPWTPNSIP